MTEEQKIYIRGSKDRPDDVRKILEQHGGKKGATTNFTFSDYFYYIKHDGTIDRTPEGSELYKMITEYYREVKLPNYSEEWKTEDILDNLTQDELYSLAKYILNQKMSDETFQRFKEEWFG